MILLLVLQIALQACDMSALIMRWDKDFSDFSNGETDNTFTDYDTPLDYAAFVMDSSSSFMHNDGYGILYYPKKRNLLANSNYWYKYVYSSAVANQVWYTGNYFNPENEPDLFDKALIAIMNQDNRASIMMCHARSASQNPFAPGNHPFRMNLNERTYSLMHNGFVSTATRTFMINEIYNLNNDWFILNQPNYTNFVNAAFPACWIDSEVLFHYLMAHIEAEKFDVYNGMRTALQKLEGYFSLSTEVVNFVFSDGERLYTFRSTPLTGTNSYYQLCFKVDNTGYSSVRTGEPAPQETEIRQFELVILDNNGAAERYPDFLDEPEYVIHKISNGHINGPTRSLPIIPNLSYPGISVSFSLEEATQVTINLYNSKGQLVARLSNGILNTGSHVIRWNGKNQSGKTAARGVYYLEIVKDGQRLLQRVTYIK